MSNNVLKLALPDGNLTPATEKLFVDAKLHLERSSRRDYKPDIPYKNVVVKMLKSQEVPDYIAEGDFDLGITGYDRIEDWRLGKGASDSSEKNLVQLRDLEYGVVQTVLAVPIALDGVDDFETLIQKFPNCRFAAEYVWLVKNYLEGKGFEKPNMRLPNGNIKTGSPLTIIYSWGATEAKPSENADAVVENIETKHTLTDNKLKVVDTVMDYSSARLIANMQSLHDPEKAIIIDDIERALMSVVNARSSYHLYVNIPTDRIEKAKDILPAISSPTISKCIDPNWLRIDTVVPREDYPDIERGLLDIGATGFLPDEPPRLSIDLPPRLYEV